MEGPPPAARERLQLLSGVTGYNEPGVLLALMGGSGAGGWWRRWVRLGHVRAAAHGWGLAMERYTHKQNRKLSCGRTPTNRLA